MGFIKQYLIWIELGAAAAILAMASYGTFYVTRDHYQKQIAQIQLSMAQAVQDELIANQKIADERSATIKQAGEQHAQDQIDINTLRDAYVSRLPVHIPICGSTLPKGGKTSSNQDGAARILSETIDRALAEVQAGDGVDSARADQLNIDAIENNSASK